MLKSSRENFFKQDTVIYHCVYRRKPACFRASSGGIMRFLKKNNISGTMPNNVMNKKISERTKLIMALDTTYYVLKPLRAQSGNENENHRQVCSS
jgi:hypothetical protein